jgi:DNA-binding protein H-NS
MATLKSIADTEWVAVFVGMNLIEQDILLDELTAIHNAGKEKRRQELRTELGSLTDRPMKSKPAKVKVKYRGPNGETWSGVGAMAGWLKKLKDAGEDVERYRVDAYRANESK